MTTKTECQVAHRQKESAVYLCNRSFDHGWKCCKALLKHKNNAAMSMRGKQPTNFFDSSTTLTDKRKQNDSGAEGKYNHTSLRRTPSGLASTVRLGEVSFL